MRRFPWLLFALGAYAVIRWRQAWTGWDTEMALRLWRHDVAALSDAQLEALYRAFLRERDRGLL